MLLVYTLLPSTGLEETTKEASKEMGKYPGINVETEQVRFYRAHSAASHIPFDIYVHDPGQDQWTSAEIGRDGMWHKEICHEISTALHDIRARHHERDIQVLDIGANVGYVSLWSASTSDAKVHVTSIEPHPFHNSLLEKTLSLPSNKRVADKISLHKVAVGTYTEAGGTLCMRINPTNAAQRRDEGMALYTRCCNDGGQFVDRLSSH